MWNGRNAKRRPETPHSESPLSTGGPTTAVSSRRRRTLQPPLRASHEARGWPSRSPSGSVSPSAGSPVAANELPRVARSCSSQAERVFQSGKCCARGLGIWVPGARIRLELFARGRARRRVGPFGTPSALPSTIEHQSGQGSPGPSLGAPTPRPLAFAFAAPRVAGHLPRLRPRPRPRPRRRSLGLGTRAMPSARGSRDDIGGPAEDPAARRAVDEQAVDVGDPLLSVAVRRPAAPGAARDDHLGVPGGLGLLGVCHGVAPGPVSGASGETSHFRA